MEHARHLGHYEKIKSTNYGYRRRRRGINKAIEELFNRIIAENFPKLKRVIQVQEAYKASNLHDQKWNTPRHIIKHSTQRTMKEY
jgi:hypothetical protein